MTPRDHVISQLRHRETKSVPYTLSFEGDVEQRLDEYYGSCEWRNMLTQYLNWVLWVDTIGEKQISETRFRDAFGGIWRFDRRPWHLEEPPMREPSFANYEFPSSGRFLSGIDAEKDKAKRRIQENPDMFHCISMGWGLFEQSWRIRGFENALMDSVINPDFYGELLERLTDLYLEFVRACADVPADAIMFGDDWGDQRGVILGPERWRTFLKSRWAKIYQEVHSQGKYVITHCCGSVTDIMDDIVEIGVDVLESVQPEARGMNPYQLKQNWGDSITFWGGLGSQSVVPFGTPEQIRQETHRLCQEMGKGGGYILAPAKSLQPETPTINAVAVVEAFTHQHRF